MQKLPSQCQNQLLRCPSVQETLKHGTNTTIHTSCSSIDQTDDEFRRSAIKWLLEFDRKVTKDTNYLSVWYLEIVLRNGLQIKEFNWQLVAAAIMMFAGKMNEIYYPSISTILKRCNSTVPVVTKEALIEMQGRILNLLNFSIAIQSPYNILSQILSDSKKDFEECQKLLKLITYNKEINKQQSDILAYAIIYLIARNKIDSKIQGEIRNKIKLTAQQIYNYYKVIRKGQDPKNAKLKSLPTTHEKLSQKQSQISSPKQNITIHINGIYSSVGSNYQSQTKKIIETYSSQLARANSYKCISKPFSQTTNIGSQLKTLQNYVPRDDLKDNFKSMNFYFEGLRRQ